MKDSPSAVRHSQINAAARPLACAALLTLSAASAAAQSPTDGSTPSGLTPGSPAGSYALSDFDTVNLYNGSLNFRLPLLKIGGRGGAGYPVTLHVEKKWTVHKHYEVGVGNFYFADGGWWSEEAEGWRLFDAGKVDIRSARREQPAGTTVETLTRVTFTAPDGTEYDLRDQQTNGQPVAPQAGGFNRGRVFVTSDGTSATFLSDWDVLDDPTLGQGFYDDRPDGYLLLKDGMRFRVVDGKIAWMRDRNGNKVTFGYDINRRVTSVTDSLSRQVTIVYATTSVPYTEISFAGFGGAARTLRIGQTNLGSALRSGQTLKTIGQLFPELHGGGPADPTVVSYVELPDGRRYRLFYNSYAELARVELPTGGAVEYDHTAGLADGAASGVFSVTGGGGAVTEKHVYRRVVERRVYPAGGTGTDYESRTAYSRPETTAANAGHVVSDSYDPSGALLARSRHYFHGSPRASFSQKPTQYAAYKDGREHKTEAFAADGTTVLRRATQAFAQRAAVTWWTGDAELAPPNDPRLTETVATLADTNQVSKQTFAYDQYNNQTDAYDYDYGAGAAGALLRRAHTDYVTAAAYVGADPDPAVGAHLRALPSQTWVSSDAAGNAKVLRTTYEYDNYADDARHKPLVARANITSHDTSVYSTTFTRRGNVTGVTSYADAAAQTGGVTASTQYDVAGNPVKSIDARGNASTVGYSDSFCNGAGCGGAFTANTYAFPTSTASAVPDPAGTYGSSTALVTSTKYDFRTGLVYSVTDANGQTTTFAYADELDRPTSQVRPDGSRTDIEYGDVVGNLHVRVLADLDATRRKESLQYFDGLGRAVRSFGKEGQEAASPWLTADTQYDALGRTWRVSNQYRSAGPGSPVNPSGRWTTTTYDALGRVASVTTPDDPARDQLPAGHPDRQEPFPKDAASVSAYSGDKMMITDQAGKRRISRSDALGRLTDVWEVTAADASTVTLSFGGVSYNAYRTSYRYDAVGNLRKVEQGAQVRFYAYDSLSRLVRARHPEQGAMATDADFPALTDSSSGTANGQWSLGYNYDAGGNLLKRKDARNVTAAYTYDAVGRNTVINYSDATPDVALYYDGATLGKGRAWRSEAAGVSRQTVAQYDSLGRPKAYSQQFWAGSAWGAAFNVARTYDRAGNLLTQTYPSGRTVSYTYDAAGRLASFAGNLGDAVQRTYSTGIVYDESGGMSREQYGTQTPLYNRRFYNSRGQVAEVRLGTYHATDAGWWNRGAILNVYSAQAGWTESGPDNNGNLRKQMVFVPNDDAISGGWQTNFFYDYDSLNRLAAVREVQNGQNLWVQDYDYDRFGNRTVNAAGTQVYGTNPSYSVPEPQYTASATTNRLSAPSGYAMTYDAAGNLTYDNYMGEGARTYDAEGRMTSAQFISGQSQTATYAYDADGRRVKRILGAGGEVWQVYGVGGELLAEYAAGAAPSSPQKEYGRRAGELLVTAGPAAEVRWLVCDHLGTPRMVVAKSGALSAVSRHDYLPFGEELAAGFAGRTNSQGYSQPDGSRQKFAGSERDEETGLDYMQARYYGAAAGRFASVDPVFFQKEMMIDPQRFNLYAYVRNNPLRFVDPKGEAIELTGDEKERQRKLELLRQVVGSEAGAYLYQKTVTDKDGKTRHFVAIHENGPDGKSKPFWAVNDVAADVGRAINDKFVAQLEFVPQGRRVEFEGQAATIGTVNLTLKISPGATGVARDGRAKIFLLDPSSNYGALPARLMSNYRDSRLEPSDVLAHEIGHLLFGWGHVTGPSGVAAVDLENRARRLRDPNAPSRTGHTEPDDAKGPQPLEIKIRPGVPLGP